MRAANSWLVTILLGTYAPMPEIRMPMAPPPAYWSGGKGGMKRVAPVSALMFTRNSPETALR